MSIESVRPVENFYGTNLSSKVSGYDKLSERITWSLGYPLVNVEIHKNQLYDAITTAVEMFTKFAGYTTEYLVFNSSLYEVGKGIRLDKLFAITPDLAASYTSVNVNVQETNPRTVTTTVTSNNLAQTIYSFYVNDTTLDPVEYTIRVIDNTTKHQSVRKVLLTIVHTASTLSAAGVTNGIFKTYSLLFTSPLDLGTFSISAVGAHEQQVLLRFKPTLSQVATDAKVILIANDNIDSTLVTAASTISMGSYDGLKDDYRKVVEVFGFEEGSNTGINTLFTIEQSLAQQSYFSHSMGNQGFDLVSWHTVKEWLELRSKLFAQERSYVFNPHTQYLRMYPEPISQVFYGVIGCYLEKKIVDMLHEPWVLQYALALTKIVVGRVRSKYSGTALFGGGTLDTEILGEGKEEKAKLEEMLLNNSPGYGDAEPPIFFVG